MREEKGRRGAEKGRRGEEEKTNKVMGDGRYIKQYFRWKLIVVGAINFRRQFRRKLIEIHTKKVWKSRQTFLSVGTGSDGHVSNMRSPSVISSVCDVGHSVGNSDTDTCQTCVRQTVGDSVGIGHRNGRRKSVGISVGECGKIP